MRHTFHSERAITEQLNTCETSLKTIFTAYNQLDSQLSQAEGHAPKNSEVDNIRFAESVYRSFNVSKSILEGRLVGGIWTNKCVSADGAEYRAQEIANHVGR